MFGIPVSMSAAISGYRLTVERITRIANNLETFGSLPKFDQNSLLKVNVKILATYCKALLLSRRMLICSSQCVEPYSLTPGRRASTKCWFPWASVSSYSNLSWWIKLTIAKQSDIDSSDDPSVLYWQRFPSILFSKSNLLRFQHFQCTIILSDDMDTIKTMFTPLMKEDRMKHIDYK